MKIWFGWTLVIVFMGAIIFSLVYFINPPVVPVIRANEHLTNKQILQRYADKKCSDTNDAPDKAINITYNPDDKNPIEITNYYCMTLSDHTVWAIPVGIHI